MNAHRPILLVEHNVSDGALTKQALAQGHIGNEPIVAEDGQDALDYLWSAGAYKGRQPAELPALILLDLKLPKVPGLEVLRQLRANQLTCRNTYMRKPVNFREFARAIEQLGLYWLVLNEPPPNVG